MIALIQRVSEACVTIDDVCVATIGAGMMVLVGVEASDTEESADRLANRILGYRIFPDTSGKMNLDVLQSCGGVLPPRGNLEGDLEEHLE